LPQNGTYVSVEIHALAETVKCRVEFAISIKSHSGRPGGPAVPWRTDVEVPFSMVCHLHFSVSVRV
jgi:hypothetical protein